MRQAVTLALALVAVLVADPAFARHRYSFVPGHHGYARGARHGGGYRHSGYGRHAFGSRHRGGSGGEAVSAPPPPGSGFTMEDGVLTYPAPARFQPKNLKRPGSPSASKPNREAVPD